MEEEKCCELINPIDWDGKEITWDNKLFIKKQYFALFYIPIGLDAFLKNIMKELHEKDLLPKEPPVMVFRNEGMFGGEVYIALNKEDPAYETETISGRFFTKYFEGKEYREAGNWFKQFKEETSKQEMNIKEIISFYALCPGCAKKFGKVQTVLFGRL